MSGGPVNVVVDTNLFVSALISARGTPRALYTAWRDGAFTLHLGDPQRAELVAVLARPHFRERFGVSDDETRELFYLLETRARRASLRDPLPIRVRDPKDEQILAAALGAGVGYLVSGDADFLVLADDPRLGALRIVTARDSSSYCPRHSERDYATAENIHRATYPRECSARTAVIHSLASPQRARRRGRLMGDVSADLGGIRSFQAAPVISST